jgi:hypothetical protein
MTSRSLPGTVLGSHGGLAGVHIQNLDGPNANRIPTTFGRRSALHMLARN